MSSPVKLKTETFYSVENYGTAMTPFYTNLAIWVGGIVLIAIFKMEVDKSEKIKNFTPTQAYFGRWMLFILVGFVQALIICLGDIFILKINVPASGTVCCGRISSSICICKSYLCPVINI